MQKIEKSSLFTNLTTEESAVICGGSDTIVLYQDGKIIISYPSDLPIPTPSAPSTGLKLLGFASGLFGVGYSRSFGQYNLGIL